MEQLYIDGKWVDPADGKSFATDDPATGALALTGRRAMPTRLLAEGYEFAIPDFERAAALAVAAT